MKQGYNTSRSYVVLSLDTRSYQEVRPLKLTIINLCVNLLTINDYHQYIEITSIY